MSAFRFVIIETRQFSTKQRPDPVTTHGPYDTKADAIEAMRIKARKAFRNTNTSSFRIEEVY